MQRVFKKFEIARHKVLMANVSYNPVKLTFHSAFLFLRWQMDRRKQKWMICLSILFLVFSFYGPAQINIRTIDFSLSR